MIKTILFDLDGTLLPMDQEKFIQTYFAKLTRHMAIAGLGSEQMIQWIWAGTKAMMENDGSKTNREVFFEVFGAASKKDSTMYEPVFDKFYQTEFDTVKEILGKSFGQKEMLADLKTKGYQLILATAPLFPSAAVATRLNWIGLTLEDFDYVSAYENSTYCKPNPNYYSEILKKNNCNPSECLMIGNNVREDGAAIKAGVDFFLITDYLENADNENIDNYQNGDSEKLKQILKELQEVTKC